MSRTAQHSSFCPTAHWVSLKTAYSVSHSCVIWKAQGSEAREAVALTAFQPQDMASRHHQPLPHHSPAQTKRQRLAPPHSLHRQQHPPLPAIPVNNRQPLPAIPEMTSRSMHHGHRSRMHHSQAPGTVCSSLFLCRFFRQVFTLIVLSTMRPLRTV